VRPDVKAWLYKNVWKIPTLDSKGLLDPSIIPEKKMKVKVVNSLSEPGELGELRFFEGDLYAWILDTNQIPARNDWVVLTFGVLDGGEI
jgi:hypothetical protein